MSYVIASSLTLKMDASSSTKTPICICQYRGADKSLARPGRKQVNVSVRLAWISFGALPYRKRKLMTASVSMLLKSRASLTCFRACFLPGRTKDLSAPRYIRLLIAEGFNINKAIRFSICCEDCNEHWGFIQGVNFSSSLATSCLSRRFLCNLL